MWDRTENQIMLAFIRHGATRANQERRYLGKTDEPLSEEGIELLKAYKMRKFYPDVEYLFCSPMKRCTETAEILYPALRPIMIPEWEEIDFGRFEYKNYEELKEEAEYQKWLDSGGTLDFPGGESRKAFALRCKKGFLRMCHELSRAAGWNVEKCAAKCTPAPKRGSGCSHFHSVGIIVHGGVIMSLLSLYAGKDYFDYQAANGRGYVCILTGMNDRTFGAGSGAGAPDVCTLAGADRTIKEDDIQIKVTAEI